MAGLEDYMGIRQLASELQLSIGTISRALNDRPDVNPETRARVKAAAAQAGYVPNQSGRSLRSGRTGIVAAVICTRNFAESTDSGLFAILEGARRTLRRQALDLIVLFRGPDEDPLENLQRIVQRRIADAVIVSETVADDPRIAYLKATGVDYVVFGRSAGLADYPFVDMDFESMARQVAEVFVRDGHRRLAVAVSGRDMNYERIVFEVFRTEALRLGLRTDEIELLPMPGGVLAEAARAAFADPERAPSAVLTTHESLAGVLYGDFAAMGLKLGEDVSVVCSFPSVDTRSLVPPLSHFGTDLDAIGSALAEYLIGLQPDAPAGSARPAAHLVPLTFAPRASHGRAARRVTA